MKVFLNEINENGKDLDFNESSPWLASAVFSLDEVDHSLAPPKAKRADSKARSIALHLNLRKVDQVVVITANVSATIRLLCSRCAKPIEFDCKGPFSCLFSQDPDMAGVSHLKGGPGGKPSGQRHGVARHAHEELEADADPFALGSQDIDITHLTEDYINLSDVVLEHLRLQIPYQPLCSADCKGMCPNCGADLNKGRCACDRIVPQTAFTALKDFKLKKS